MTEAEHLANQLVDSVCNKLKAGITIRDTPANRAADKRKIARAIQRIIDDAVAVAGNLNAGTRP